MLMGFFIGISHLNPQLTLAGRSDVAYCLLLREDYPSWLYPVKHGATTIWERWNGWTPEQGFGDAGSVNGWDEVVEASHRMGPAVFGKIKATVTGGSPSGLYAVAVTVDL